MINFPRISILTGDLKGTFLTFLMWKGRTTESSKSLSLDPSEAGKPTNVKTYRILHLQVMENQRFVSLCGATRRGTGSKSVSIPSPPGWQEHPKIWNRSIWWICIHHGKTPTPDFTKIAPFPSKDPPISFTLESPNWLRPRSCSGASPTWWSRIRQRLWTSYGHGNLEMSYLWKNGVFWYLLYSYVELL